MAPSVCNQAIKADATSKDLLAFLHSVSTVSVALEDAIYTLVKVQIPQKFRNTPTALSSMLLHYLPYLHHITLQSHRMNLLRVMVRTLLYMLIPQCQLQVVLARIEVVLERRK